jgi:hypothetical protein
VRRRAKQCSPALGAGFSVDAKIAAAEAAARIPKVVRGVDGRQILWRPPPRPQISSTIVTPRKARGWIVSRAFARATSHQLLRNPEPLPTTKKGGSSSRLSLRDLT